MPAVRQGQPAAPATQVSVTHTPLVHSRPVSQESAAPQAQPIAPAGQVSHWPPVVQRRPALQVLLARQLQAASPRRQSTQLPPRHSPVVHVVPTQAQPITPEQPASTSTIPESPTPGI